VLEGAGWTEGESPKIVIRKGEKAVVIGNCIEDEMCRQKENE